MVAVLVEDDAYSPVLALTAAVDDLLAMTFTCLPTRELPALAAAVETQLRRLPVFDHALIAEMDRRDLAGEVGARSTAAVLVDALRLTPGEAKTRVTAAENLGPRVGLGGEPLPALFPHLLAAQADGAISVEHARVVVHTIDRLPHALQLDHADAVETVLVAHARDFNPTIVAGLGRRIRDHLDPDGTLTEEADRQRRRSVSLHHRPDGSGQISGELTAGCAAKWQALFDALAKPATAADGVGDPRTPDQRRHDAIDDIADRLLRGGDLPDSGGTPATVVLTMTLDQLETRTGLATTAHGGSISIAQALTLAGAGDIIPIVINHAGGILSYGRTRRDASPRQRIVLAGRDRGCSFPGCDIPPAWCQAHHITAWKDGGHTTLTNLTLLCGHHHREFERLGWTCRLTDGIPWWTPPPWIDPHQTPQRNSTHHLERLLPLPPAEDQPDPWRQPQDQQ